MLYEVITLDDTPTSYTYRKIIRKFEEEYMRPKFKILNFKSNDSVSSVINSLSDNCMVYLFNLNYSPNNNYIPYDLYLKTLNQPCKIPIFANQFDDIKGLIGGEYNSGTIHGIAAAELAYKTLNKIPISYNFV